MINVHAEGGDAVVPSSRRPVQAQAVHAVHRHVVGRLHLRGAGQCWTTALPGLGRDDQVRDKIMKYMTNDHVLQNRNWGGSVNRTIVLCTYKYYSVLLFSIR